MRKTFQNFYEPEQKPNLDLFWKTAYFSFDTSVLLELFDVSTETRNDFISFVEKIPKDRRWLTFQVAREYHAGVDRVIQRHLSKEQQARNIVTSAKLPSFEELTKSKVVFSANAKEVFDAHLLPLKAAFDAWKIQVNNTVDSLLAQYHADCESTKNRIADLFDDCVGKQYDEEWLKNHHEIAKIRMQNQFPPGYSDSSKTGNVNGDVFLWFELIDETQKRAVPLVFVTKDQQKDDWFLKDHNSKVLCPRPELINEMRVRTGQDLLLCTMNDFLAFAKERGEMKESSVEEFTAIDEENFKRSDEFQALQIQKQIIDDEIKLREVEIAHLEKNDRSGWRQQLRSVEARAELRVLQAERAAILNDQWSLFLSKEDVSDSHTSDGAP